MKTSEKHGVVLGGSLAGLLAARVLADQFDHVTLIERDVYTDNCETRRGIPQANHVHGLLVRGRQILEELFPGVQEEMIAAGAAEPITLIKTHRATQNRVRRYDRAELPHNLLLLGDAVCAFNPVYGQSMTIASLGAVTLHKNLIEQR